ncbi:zinc finger, C2H2 type family protein (macronuclear) [Tetrahymena thermophila SB210]|uniref:Zinc finger, C2H2 type family protein n=1 Tax=Tetrahymena thermophila (strain SB210) TaxID=312017 RepID=Q22GZ9_TETTS|nr:zinc finger, C2H2 type family protein [Tetrahymena thermophila SB210]EAR84525.1 zinc finger, C2H2 type family protein [Tetrahymena thermophila SB210]|eukprot:XP_001032188.1 zinc finger, C2H2 type family protein [Tetrahymena thermophila SB210]
MGNKRPLEDQFLDESQIDQDDRSSSDQNNKAEIFKNFECKCGKVYCLQSSLFNHIKIKHDNNKQDFVVPRGIPTGRPKKQDCQNNGIKKYEQIKNQKPKDVDQNTWDKIQIYRNPLFQNLIIGFKDKMRSDFIESEEIMQQNWSEYEKNRQKLFKIIQFPVRDVKQICNTTDSILQAWGILLRPDYQVGLYQIFISQYLLKFYDLPDQKRDLIKSQIQNNPNNQRASKIIKEILNQQYEIQQNDDKQQNEEQKQDDNEPENQQNLQQVPQIQDEKQYEKLEDHVQDSEVKYEDDKMEKQNIENTYVFDPNEIMQQIKNDDQSCNRQDLQQNISYLNNQAFNVPSFRLIYDISQKSFAPTLQESSLISQFMRINGREFLDNDDEDFQ